MPTPAALPDQQLRAGLQDLQQRISEKRDERAAAVARAEQTKAAFARLGRLSTEAPEFIVAEKARLEVQRVARELDALQRDEVGILKVLGGRDTAEAPGEPSHIDTKVPGGWLASLRTKSLDTTDLGSTTDLGTPLSDRLTFASAIEAAGPTVLNIDTTSVKVPVVGAPMDKAPVVPEMAPIPTDSDPDISLREVEPPKIARIVEVSREAWTDGRAPVLAAFERELVRSIAEGQDDMAINAAAVDPGGPGLLHVTGSLATDAAGALANLDAFSDAIGQLVAAGNDPMALAVILHPLTWSRLMALKRSADSNEPLVAPAAPGPGTTQRQPLSLLGARVYLTPTMPAAKAVVGAPREWLLVVRDNEVAASEHAMFSTGGVAVRAIRRAQLVVTQPTTLDVISNLPTG